MRLRESLLKQQKESHQALQAKLRENYETIKQKIKEAEEAEENVKSEKELYFLKIYAKLMDTMSHELQVTKEKYRSINKQKLKEEKLLKLASRIKIFREECFFLREHLKQLKTELEGEKKKCFLLDTDTSIVTSCIHRSRERKQILTAFADAGRKPQKSMIYSYRYHTPQYKSRTLDITDRKSPLYQQLSTSKAKRCLFQSARETDRTFNP